MKVSSDMGTLVSATLAIAMIAVFILAIAGVRLAIRKEERQRGLLMIAAGLVIFANVLIWTL